MFSHTVSTWLVGVRGLWLKHVNVGPEFCPGTALNRLCTLGKLLSISELQFSLLCSIKIYHSAYSISPSSKNSWYTFNAAEEKEMSKIHFLTQKGKLLSLSVMNWVQQIIDRTATKFLIKWNTTFTSIWVFAVMVENQTQNRTEPRLLSRIKVCVALMKSIVITASCF